MGDGAEQSSIAPALLLDIGGVVLRSGHEMMARVGGARPELAGFAARRGRLGPEPDPAWDDVLAGRLPERTYWAERAREAGALAGGPGEVPWLVALLYRHDPEHLRADALALVHDARGAGHAVAALTNDLAAFHRDADAATRRTHDDVLRRFDLVVDGSETGVLKPDPRAYAAALERLGRPAGEVVFLDDMPGNVEAARAVGLRAVLVEPEDPAAAFDAARTLLGLSTRAA